LVGLIAMRRGSRTRLCHRTRTHREGKSKRRSMSEWDFIGLIDGVHQLGTPKSTDGKDGNPDKGRRTPASGGSPVAGCASQYACADAGDAEQQDDGTAQAEQRLVSGLLGVSGHCATPFLCKWVHP
jgi:hypothetical protein